MLMRVLMLLHMSSLLNLSSSTSHDQYCSNGSIELTGGSSVSYKLCVSEFWGTVYFTDTICGNNWSLKNSIVVCKQLGYQDVWTYINSPVVQRSGISFRCNGTEDRISECNSFIVDHNCSSLSMGCHQLTNTSDVRLVNDYSDTVGDVEIFHHRSWKPLCYDGISEDVARRMCKQLGWHSGSRETPMPGKVKCVQWTCEEENCSIKKRLSPDWVARIKCQQYNATNAMSLDVSLTNDGVPLIIHEGRKTRLCVSDDVLDGGDDCDNTSSLPLAICEHLGYNSVEITNQTPTYDQSMVIVAVNGKTELVCTGNDCSTRQLPILIGGQSNCTVCSPSLPHQMFLNEHTICLPDETETCNATVDLVLICSNVYEEGTCGLHHDCFNVEEEHSGFGVGAIVGIIIGVLLVLLFLSPFIGGSIKSCYKKCIKSWLASDRPSIHPTGTTNPGVSKASESRGGHSLALSTSEAEPSTYDSSTLTKTHSNAAVTKDAPPNYDEALKCPKRNDNTL